jgi:SET domain-containing protein
MTLVRVGKSRIEGTGLFAATDISKGTRIIEYTGEKIFKRESRRRLEAGNAYIFHLNYRYDIDGQTFENTARYINHSCNPNCEIEKMHGTIWIVALRDITGGEELSYNYGYDSERYQENPCNCGAENCCGYILAREYWGLIKSHAGK